MMRKEYMTESELRESAIYGLMVLGMNRQEALKYIRENEDRSRGQEIMAMTNVMDGLWD